MGDRLLGLDMCGDLFQLLDDGAETGTGTGVGAVSWMLNSGACYRDEFAHFRSSRSISSVIEHVLAFCVLGSAIECSRQ